MNNIVYTLPFPPFIHHTFLCFLPPFLPFTQTMFDEVLGDRFQLGFSSAVGSRDIRSRAGLMAAARRAGILDPQQHVPALSPSPPPLFGAAAAAVSAAVASQEPQDPPAERDSDAGAVYSHPRGYPASSVRVSTSTISFFSSLLFSSFFIFTGYSVATLTTSKWPRTCPFNQDIAMPPVYEFNSNIVVSFLSNAHFKGKRG